MRISEKIEEMVKDYQPKLEGFVREKYGVDVDLTPKIVPDEIVHDINMMNRINPKVFIGIRLYQGVLGFYMIKDPLRRMNTNILHLLVKKRNKEYGIDDSRIFDLISNKENEGQFFLGGYHNTLESLEDMLIWSNIDQMEILKMAYCHESGHKIDHAFPGLIERKNPLFKEYGCLKKELSDIGLAARIVLGRKKEFIAEIFTYDFFTALGEREPLVKNIFRMYKDGEFRKARRGAR